MKRTPPQKERKRSRGGLTRAERDCLLHTVGLNQGRPCDRNYFCAGPGSDYDVSLAAMAKIGVTECYAGPREHMPYNMYRVTPLGLAVANHLKGKMDE